VAVVLFARIEAPYLRVGTGSAHEGRRLGSAGHCLNSPMPAWEDLEYDSCLWQHESVSHRNSMICIVRKLVLQVPVFGRILLT
jgi:hypothetical protein